MTNSTIFELASGLLNSNNAPAWATLIATIIGAFFMFYTKNFKLYLSRPKLLLSIMLKNPDCHKMVFNETTPGYYFRFHIRNKGKNHAKNVQLYIKSLQRKEGMNYTYSTVQNFIPMHLKWSYGDPQNANKPMITAPIILSQMGKHCDFIHIIRNDLHNFFEPSFNKPHKLNVDFEFPTSTNNSELEPGQYKFEVVLAAENCSPTYSTIYVEYDGQWADAENEMFRNHVNIRVE